MKRLLLIIVLAFAAFTSFGQERPITTAERGQIGAIVPHLLDTLYVSPEKGKQLAAQIRSAFEDGRYDSATTASALAAAINRDLAAANDRHLGIRYNGGDSSAPILTIDAWNARRAAMRSGHPTERARNLDASRMTNFGVLSAEVLDGNVGYLRMREFVNTEQARTAIASAMAFLANTDAMIVDVRNCPGGSADMVSYLASYFFDGEQHVLMNRYNRPMNRSMESTTVDVPGRRMPRTDLYILTGSTGSACESFAFTLQQWGRARTVGEKTSGAGNNNMFVDLGAGLTLSISIGSAVHPKTGKGFEAVGVLPDIEAPGARALEVAHAEALRKLSRTGSTSRSDRATNAISEVRRMEREWLDAYEKRDAAAMNRIVAEDFIITHGDGRTQTKAEVLSSLARAASSGMPAPKFTTDEVRAQSYGDTVILTGKVTMEMTRRDGTTVRREARYTDTYAWKNGAWQVVASHQGTAVDPASKAAVAVPAINLADYVGTYGVREVSIRDGALYFQRTGARGGVLKPISPDNFDLNGDVVITFNRGSSGAVTSLVIQWKDGRTETVPRDVK